MIHSSTNLATMSSLIASYRETSEALQANQKMQEEENMVLILDMYGEMSGMFKQHEMEITTLTSLSKSLKADIIQLKLQNPLELETNRLMKSIVELATSKLLEIEIHFEKLKINFAGHYHAKQLCEFKKLREKVNNLSLDEVDEFAKEQNLEEDVFNSIEKENVLIILDNQILSKTTSLIKEKITVLAKKIELLENDLFPLRQENQKLIYQKQRIIEIQRENIEKKDHDLPYKKILELVKKTYNKIIWEQLAKVNRGIFESLGCLTPSSIDFYMVTSQDQLKEYITSGKNQMTSLILTLENNIKEKKS